MGKNYTNLLLIFCTLQVFLVSIFLLSNEKGKRSSNIILGAFFFILGLNLTDGYFTITDIDPFYAAIVIAAGNLPLLFGPLLLLYTQSVVFKSFVFRKQTGLHFIPFVVAFIASAILFYMQPHLRQLQIIHAIAQRNIPSSVYLFSVIIGFQFLVYAIISLKIIRHYNRIAVDQFSNPRQSNISWLASTITFFVIFFIGSLVNNFLELTSLAPYHYLLLLLLIIVLFVFINTVLLTALKKPEIFSWIDEQEFEAYHDAPTQRPGVKTPVDGKNLEMLLQFMSTNKPFLNPDITLDELAKQVSLKPKEISRIINEQLNQNFFDFINRYRIEEAKRLLFDPADKKTTVLEVLYQVGFNSKSSFNNLFKRYTGLTPSDFKKKNLYG